MFSRHPPPELLPNLPCLLRPNSLNRPQMHIHEKRPREDKTMSDNTIAWTEATWSPDYRRNIADNVSVGDIPGDVAQQFWESQA